MNRIAAQFHILILKGRHPKMIFMRGDDELPLATVGKATCRWLSKLSRISSERMMEVHEVAFCLIKTADP